LSWYGTVCTKNGEQKENGAEENNRDENWCWRETADVGENMVRHITLFETKEQRIMEELLSRATAATWRDRECVDGKRYQDTLRWQENDDHSEVGKIEMGNIVWR
jgi:hypothetical protein